jgi:intracellular multiplication protein IcmE
MSTDFNETPGAPRYRRAGGTSFSQLLKNPIFKLVAVVALIGGVGMAGMQFLGTKPQRETTNIPVVQAGPKPAGSGAEVTPEYAQALQQSDQERVAQARAEGETAVPSIIDAPVMNPTVDISVTSAENSDPLKEFEALVRRNDTPQPTPQPIAPPPAPINPEEIRALADAYRQQMSMFMTGWQPNGMQQVSTGISNADLIQVSADSDGASSETSEQMQGKTIAPAGSMYYAHMTMEANSDVPGPIMAQILTGPFAGGKVIGTFETFRNHLLIRFNTIVFRNKEYSADILAVDPDTTLGGVVTEVDPRFLQRALLPAAAAFVKAYGKTLSEPESTVTTSGASTTTTTSTQKSGSSDAMYAGIGEAADSISGFVDDEAAATKRLVRVAVGTPIGLFFVKSVHENDH